MSKRPIALLCPGIRGARPKGAAPGAKRRALCLPAFWAAKTL
mgnify:CR=1 FL=1